MLRGREAPGSRCPAKRLHDPPSYPGGRCGARSKRVSPEERSRQEDRKHHNRRDAKTGWRVGDRVLPQRSCAEEEETGFVIRTEGLNQGMKSQPKDRKGAEMIKDVPLTGIFVNDQEAALDFYTNKLGLEKVQDEPYGEGGARWIMVSPSTSSSNAVTDPTRRPRRSAKRWPPSGRLRPARPARVVGADHRALRARDRRSGGT